MPVPQIRQYKITSPGTVANANYNKIQKLNMTNGPQGTLLNNLLDFGDIQAGVYNVVPLVYGAFGSTISSLKFFTNDWVALVNNSDNEDFYPSVGTSWDIKLKVSKDWFAVDDTVLSQIAANPGGGDPYAPNANGWMVVPHQAAPPGGLDLSNVISQLNPGNDGTTGILTAADAGGPINGTYLANAYFYLAIKPDLDALAGQYESFSWRLNYFYP